MEIQAISEILRGYVVRVQSQEMKEYGHGTKIINLVCCEPKLRTQSNGGQTHYRVEVVVHQQGDSMAESSLTWNLAQSFHLSKDVTEIKEHADAEFHHLYSENISLLRNVADTRLQHFQTVFAFVLESLERNNTEELDSSVPILSSEMQRSYNILKSFARNHQLASHFKATENEKSHFTTAVE